MNTITYRLIEIFDGALGEEREYRTLAAAKAALAQATADLVAEGFQVVHQGTESANLVIRDPGECVEHGQPDGRPLVSTRLFIATARPLVTTVVRDRAHLAELLGLPLDA